MQVIGITGLAGSGKSVVRRHLQSQGFPVIDCDELGHRVLKEDSPAREAIQKLFGTLDRQQIATIVFKHSKKLKELEKISHPQIRNLLKTELDQLAQQNQQIVFVEVSVLFKLEIQDLFSEIWLVEAPRELIIERLTQLGWNQEKIKNRLKANENLIKNIHRVDKVIKNDSTLEQLKEKIDQLIPVQSTQS